jgi:hypothetical protein
MDSSEFYLLFLLVQQSVFLFDTSASFILKAPITWGERLLYTRGVLLNMDPQKTVITRSSALWAKKSFMKFNNIVFSLPINALGTS